LNTPLLKIESLYNQGEKKNCKPFKYDCRTCKWEKENQQCKHPKEGTREYKKWKEVDCWEFNGRKSIATSNANKLAKRKKNRR